jgi:hypothetical protein
MSISKYFLEFQVVIQLYHWNTKSYPRHVASGQLYTTLVTLVDKFMETYMGKYGRENNVNGEIDYVVLNDKEIIEYIKYFKNYLESTISGKFKNDTDLINLKDEMLQNINTTLYLFTLN